MSSGDRFDDVGIGVNVELIVDNSIMDNVCYFMWGRPDLMTSRMAEPIESDLSVGSDWEQLGAVQAMVSSSINSSLLARSSTETLIPGNRSAKS